ncbi:MAG: ABC transporter transmembrane domain-containing protein [Proteobacteria bacterium]|nr:ABC transporter transmembrane domain-containing protein [Pseudomonadota bacterium]
MNLYLRLLQYARPYLIYMIGSVICMAILAGTTSAIAYLIKPAIDDVFLKKDLAMLFMIPALVVLAYFIKGAADFGQSYLMGNVGTRVVTDIRDILYRHIQSLSLSFYSKTSTGMLMSRIANDVGILQRSVSDSIKKILESVFTVIGLTGVAFYQNWKLAAICFLVLPWMAIPIVRFGTKNRRFSRKTQERMGSMTTFLDETISGNQTVKSFCMEQYENKRFFNETMRLLDVSLATLRVSAYASPIMEFFGAGVMGAGLIYCGGYLVITDAMTTGEFFSFVAAMAMLFRPIKAMSRENMKVQKGMAAAVRVFEVLDIKPDITDRQGAVALPPFKGCIEFRDVVFQYEERPVLKGLSFCAPAGEVVAFVGHSGAGKTTIVNLLLRFYDVNGGAIMIDGIDIRDVTIRSLREQIAFVAQETVLFNDTVSNNISYGSREVSQEQIIEAAKAALAHDFIQAMPEGYNTVIGERGVRLSGGQRQRMAIARALVKNAPILILDEATSALDTHSEQQVQAALENLMKGRTTIMIAHRLSTVRNADQIIVLQEGDIIERGSHRDLLEQKGIYTRLIEIQSGYEKKTRDVEEIFQEAVAAPEDEEE